MSWFWPSHWKIWSNWCLNLNKKWPVFGRITILKNLTHGPYSKTDPQSIFLYYLSFLFLSSNTSSLWSSFSSFFFILVSSSLSISFTIQWNVCINLLCPVFRYYTNLDLPSTNKCQIFFYNGFDFMIVQLISMGDGTINLYWG